MQKFNQNILTKLLIGALLMLSFSACEFEILHENFDPNSGPVTAAFEIDSISNSGFDPSTAFFKNNSTGGTIFEWNFGDPASGGDNTSTSRDPSHLYQNPGVYTVSLTVENASTNAKSTITQDITIKKTHTFSITVTGVGSRFSRGNDVLVLDNGEFLILGGIGDDSDTELYINRITVEGFTASGFPKELEVLGKGEIVSAIQNEDGDFIMTGYTNTGGFNDSKVAMFKINQSMKLASGYPKTYGASTRGSGISIIQNQTGGYSIVGGIGGSGGSDLFVTMVDPNGNEQSNFPRTYNEFDFTEQASAIQQLDNGEYIMMGTDQTLFRLFINRMDANGNDLGGNPFYIDDRDGRDFVDLPDGSLMIVGRELHRIDINGNDFPGFPRDLGNRFSGMDIIKTRDGNVAFVGQDDDDLVLYKTDLNGNPFPGFPKTFPSTSRSIGNAVAEAPDGGFIIAGTIFSSNSKAYIIKTDSEGLLR